MKLFSNRTKLISLQREGGFPALDSRPFIRHIFREGHEDISWVGFSSMDCQGVAPPDADLGSCAVSQAAIHMEPGMQRTTEVLSQGSGGQKPGSKVSEGPPPSQGSRRGSLLLPAAGGPSFLGLCPHHSSLCLCHLMALSSVYLCLLLFGLL